MPELPEIETIKRGISPHLKNQVIKEVIVRENRLRWSVPTTLPTDLRGQQIKQIQRRGKYLLFNCTEGNLLIHLGMSGNLRLLPVETTLKKHDHVDIILMNNTCLRYHDPRRFGCILWTKEPILSHPLLRHLGVEPLEENFTGEYLYQQAQHKKSPIKSFIMNNKFVVGVGNIYANEALFIAGIHPMTPIGTINLVSYEKLVASIQHVLRTAIAMGGTTLRDFTDSEGKPGYFKQVLQVYARQGEKCLQCGQLIELQKIGQRASYFCPNCQTG